MLEILKERKAALEAQGQKGFTLMEMLIVIAIIAVLIAIAIPVFSAQLDKANTETDAANIRGGYAEATAKILTENVTTDGTTYYLNSDGTVTTTASGDYQCKGTSGDDGIDISGQNVKWAKNDHIKYVYHQATTGTNAKEAYIEIVKVS